MGGVSDGKVTLEQDGEMYYARLTGNVSTRNYGGVIQLRTGISFANSEKDGKNLQGVRLNVRGNGETYDIHIITNDMAYYGDFYSATFQADSDWKMIDLPFNKFERRWSKNTALDPKKIRNGYTHLDLNRQLQHLPQVRYKKHGEKIHVNVGWKYATLF